MNATDLPDMTKQEAIELLGGTQVAVARAIGITPQAVAQWPDPLPARLADRVIAARWRLDQAHKREAYKRFARDAENKKTSGKG